MQYLILGTLLMASVTWQKSKKIAALNLIFMWIIFSFNYNNADYNNYIRIFNNPQISSDIGFVVMCKLFKRLNLSYNFMLGFIGAICLRLLFSTFKRMTNKTALVTGLYMMAPFFTDVIQIRNFIMMSIVLYCLKFLDEGHTRKDIVLYVVGILCASTFHVLALVYLALPLMNRLSLKLTLYLGVFGSVGVWAFFSVARKLFPRMEFYGGSVPLWMAALFLMPYLVFFIVGLYTYYKTENSHLSKELRYVVIRGSIYLFMYNILLLKNLNYHRIFRNFLPVLEVQFAELFKKRQSITNFIMFGVLFATILFRFTWGWEEKAILLSNNYIFDILF